MGARKGLERYNTPSAFHIQELRLPDSYQRAVAKIPIRGQLDDAIRDNFRWLSDVSYSLSESHQYG